MAIVLAHSGNATNAGGASTSRSITLTSTTAGNLLVLGILVYTSAGAGGGNGTITVGPSGWTGQFGGSPLLIHPTTNIYGYYFENCTGGLTSASVTVDNVNDSTIMVYGEYSGIATASSRDSTSNTTDTGNSGAGNTAMTTNTSYASANAVDVFITLAGMVGASTTFTSLTGGYTIEQHNTVANAGDVVSSEFEFHDKIVAAAGTNNWGGKGIANKDWGNLIQAFKAPASNPPAVSDQSNPRPFTFPNVGFGKSTYEALFGPLDTQPFPNYDQPNPQQPKRSGDLRTWTQATPIQYGPLDTAPIKNFDFPNPRPPLRAINGWLQAAPFWLEGPIDIDPFGPFDWPNPMGLKQTQTTPTWFNPSGNSPSTLTDHELQYVEPLTGAGPQAASRHPSVVNAPNRVF